MIATCIVLLRIVKYTVCGLPHINIIIIHVRFTGKFLNPFHIILSIYIS